MDSNLSEEIRIRPGKTRPGNDRLPATGGVVRSGAAT